MPRFSAALLIAVAIRPALAAEPAEATAAAQWPGHTKGLNLMVSALNAPRMEWRPSGFLLGFAVEGPIGQDGDANVGMSYLRLTGFGAPVTVVSLADLTISQRNSIALLGGVGMGTVSAQAQTRFGTRLFFGAELFHRRALPISLVFELIMKFCEDGPQPHVCRENEQQTWVAGRLGFRL
jgi:hypothetical protein